MNRKSTSAGPVLAAFTILALVGLAVWWEVATWQECRQTNSFFYCMRVLHQ
jgi:hypothetical protein